MSVRASTAPRATGRAAAVAVLLDAVSIVVFAAIGRASHSEADPLADSVLTAWPFLAGAAVGWVLGWLRTRRPAVGLVDGLPVWVGAVAVGMLLRHLTGRGVAPSFVVVATIFLGLFLLGWRAVGGLRSRKVRR